MEPRSLQFAAQACAGELPFPGQTGSFCRVSTDSRSVQPGDLFVALAGDRFDAHAFLPQVARSGVAGLLVEAGRVPPGFASPVPMITVRNTRRALGALAGAYRRQFQLLTVAVGGSNGKTTTKELLASVLRQNRPTLWSQASFNNDIGVPLTLLELGSHHEAAVLEVGTNHPGELPPLLELIQPGYGVITSIGREHMEFFGDLEGVAQEEGYVGELLPAGGVLFLNAESDYTTRIMARTRARVIRVGWSKNYECNAFDIRLDPQGTSFQARTPWAHLNGPYQLQLLGRHQVTNALLALAVGAELGLSREEISRGLAECAPAKMRLQTWSAHGVQVVEDCYNANADSMLAALETLQELPCLGRRVAVLGEMGELGAHSAAAHAEVGRKTAETQVDCLWAVGPRSGEMAQAARTAGLKNIVEFASVTEAGAALAGFVRTGDVILLKASRASRLEQAGATLREKLLATGRGSENPQPR